MKGLQTIVILSLMAGTTAMAQLNTASPYYLSLVAGAVSSGDDSPYAIPKKVAADESLFRNSENPNYKSAEYKNAEFAVFENKINKHHAFQILLIKPKYTLLCEHYVEESCDCFEGLHILKEESTEPLRVRKIWPFSLKANLVDEIEAVSENEFRELHFETVCEILEFLD